MTPHIRLITGSQHLYGEATLRLVAENSQTIARFLDHHMPVAVVWQPVATTPESIRHILADAEADAGCVGAIAWMHTFSPAKMWINGLKRFSKPLLHLHTQFNRELPWAAIDMDFMNLNQSAHGDREFGFLCARMRLPRQVTAGYWQDPEVLADVETFCRVARAVDDMQHMKVARIGDNMREVAVTEGNKVSAQMAFGYSVNGYGVADLVKYVDQAADAEIDRLVAGYREQYRFQADDALPAVREAARIELGLRAFLDAGGFTAFTTTFEDLNGLAQLPGLAVQRLMADGYGFGAEGDWKLAALTRTLKVMGAGLDGGTSFIEDYTYHLARGAEVSLGAHMLEVCPSIADDRPSLEVHPLGIGGKSDPARLVFTARPGRALNASLIDLGDRFRLVVNTLEAVTPPEDLPRLPVARAVLRLDPDFRTSATAWILAGGAHHSVYSQAVTPAMLESFAELTGVELAMIDAKTDLSGFKRDLRINEVYYSGRRS